MTSHKAKKVSSTCCFPHYRGFYCGGVLGPAAGLVTAPNSALHNICLAASSLGKGTVDIYYTSHKQ